MRAPTPPSDLRELVTDCLREDRTLFQLLGVTPVEAESEPGRLQTVRRALMRDLHPDRWGEYSAEWQSRATRAAAAVNVAVDTLCLPRARQQYLLRLRSTHYMCTACAGDGAHSRQVGSFRKPRVEYSLCAACDGAGWLLRGDRSDYAK